MNDPEKIIKILKKMNDSEKIKKLIEILIDDYKINYDLFDRLFVSNTGDKKFAIDVVFYSLENIKNKYSYDGLSSSIPTKEIICEIDKFLKKKNCKTVIEIGSGSGLWIALLQIIQYNDKNITFYATDNDLNPDYKHKYTNVEKIDAIVAIEKYKFCDCLFLCWPPSQFMVEEGQYSSGDMLEKFKGNYLIYIGEFKSDDYSPPSISGDDKFFDLLRKDWKLYQKPIENPGKNGPFTDDTKIYLYERIPIQPTIRDELIKCVIM